MAPIENLQTNNQRPTPLTPQIDQAFTVTTTEDFYACQKLCQRAGFYWRPEMKTMYSNYFENDIYHPPGLDDSIMWYVLYTENDHTLSFDCFAYEEYLPEEAYDCIDEDITIITPTRLDLYPTINTTIRELVA